MLALHSKCISKKENKFKTVPKCNKVIIKKNRPKVLISCIDDD